MSDSGGQINLYGYVVNDPVNMTDPNGKDFWNYLNCLLNPYNTDPGACSQYGSPTPPPPPPPLLYAWPEEILSCCKNVIRPPITLGSSCSHGGNSAMKILRDMSTFPA
jgi:hypothetical protein